jgi:hypothetical protein
LLLLEVIRERLVHYFHRLLQPELVSGL